MGGKMEWNQPQIGGGRGELPFPPQRCLITTQKKIDLDKIYDQKDNLSAFKPLGLWYSIGNSWYKFMKFRQKYDYNENYKLPKNLNIFKLTIYPRHLTTDIKNPNPNKILQLKTYDDVKLFNKIYKTDYYKKPKKFTPFLI